MSFVIPSILGICAVPRIAKEDHEFYQMLLNNTATACQPSSILTLFLDGEVSPALRVTPAIDTVKAVFKHLEDPEAGREFFATTFENLQVRSALTCCEQSACMSWSQQEGEDFTFSANQLGCTDVPGLYRCASIVSDLVQTMPCPCALLLFGRCHSCDK